MTERRLFTKEHEFACDAGMGDTSSAGGVITGRYFSRHDS
jgi:hypothetical protein